MKKKGDIVDRLRDWGHPDWYYVTSDLLAYNEEVRREAADEIENLRSRLALALSRPSRGGEK